MLNKLLITVLLSIASLSAQDNYGTTSSGAYFRTTKNAVGATSAFDVDCVNHTLFVVVVSPATCTFRLEGSEDNTNWVDLSGTQPCTTPGANEFHVDGKIQTYVRVYLVSYSGDAVGAKVNIYYRGSKY